jgi:O-Antigen ligase
MIARLLVGLVVFWVGFDRGSYGIESRTTLAIAVWWAVGAGVAAGVLPLARVRRGGVVAAVLLAGFALFTLVSAAWATGAEGVYLEFARSALYVGIFVLALLCASPRGVRTWYDGAALGIAALGVVALASRLFPSLAGDQELLRILPATGTRLFYPVGYWNGLAILLGLGVPLLLRTAVAARATAARPLALAALPVLAAAIYLTSSRGGAGTAILGAVAYVGLSARRGAAAAAALIGAASAATAISVLVPRHALVDGPLGSSAARSEGRSAAVLLLLAAVGTAAAWGVASRLALLMPRVPRSAGRVAIALVVVAVVAGLLAAHPVRRFHTFQQPPRAGAASSTSFVSEHLLSGAGTGRWQFWTAAADEWKTRPLAGRGAGSYEAWWARNGSFSYFVRDAHSLYVEVLGELGIVGLALLAGAFVTAVAVAARRLRVEPEGDALVALVALFIGYAFAAGVDWMWELTAVSAVALASLALACGGGGAPFARRHPALRAVLATLALVVVLSEAVPLMTAVATEASQKAARRGDLGAARSAALAAHDAQPWASSPYLQLALVSELAGDLPRARTEIRRAIARDRDDWRLWLVAARIATHAGAVAEGERALARARDLNPRSPLFSGNPATSRSTNAG